MLPKDDKLKPEEDGRNKEWEDRARVNLEEPRETSTNIERDFESEEGSDKKPDAKENPAY